jgi:hypothetical protein
MWGDESRMQAWSAKRVFMDDGGRAKQQAAAHA